MRAGEVTCAPPRILSPQRMKKGAGKKPAPGGEKQSIVDVINKQ